MRTISCLACAAAITALASCGGDSGQPTVDAAEAERASRASAEAADAKTRAGDLLDDWSDTLRAAVLATRDSAQAGDAAARDQAWADAYPRIRAVARFGSQGRLVMAHYRDGALREAVVDDGDAWQQWAIALLEAEVVDLDEAREIADLAAEAFVLHERAYAAADRKPPIDFQLRPDQK